MAIAVSCIQIIVFMHFKVLQNTFYKLVNAELLKIQIVVQIELEAYYIIIICD